MVKIKKRNFRVIYLLILSLVALLIVQFVSNESSIDYVLKKLGFLSFLMMCYTSVCIYYLCRKVNFALFFFVFLYLFSFGQSILFVFGYSLPYNSAFSIRNNGFTSDDIMKSGFFVLYAIILTSIGYVVKYKESLVNLSYSIVKDQFVGKDSVKKVGWILLAFSIFPTFYCLLIDIKTTFTLGYALTISNYTGFAKLCSLISGLFRSGFFMVFLFEEQRWKRTIALFAMGIYCALQLLGGTRAPVFSIGIVVIIIWTMYFKKINKTNVGWIVLALLGFSFLFSIVSSSRNWLMYNESLVELLKRVSSNILSDNFIVQAIREMGITQILNTLVYKECPTHVPYRYGLSFLYCLWGIIPNFIGESYKAYIGVDLTFSPLYSQTSALLGASYISEGYWNFGVVSMLYFLLFGNVTGYVDSKFEEFCNTELEVDAVNVFLIVYIMSSMIFLVRGELIQYGRNIVYYALIPAWLCNHIKGN